MRGDEFQLLDRFVGRVHRNDRHRGQPVFHTLEVIGGDDVEAADHGAAGRVVGDARDAEAGGRVDDGVVAADLVHAVVQHHRHHRGGAVAGIDRLAAPLALHRGALRLALFGGHLERVGNAALRLQKPIGAEIADRLPDLLGEDRGVFDPVAVAIDDRVRKLGADLFGTAVSAHDVLPE